jgi:hypothetical protein
MDYEGYFKQRLEALRAEGRHPVKGTQPLLAPARSSSQTHVLSGWPATASSTYPVAAVSAVRDHSACFVNLS